MRRAGTSNVVTHGDLSTNFQLLGPDLSQDTPPVALIHGLGANLSFWYLGALRHLGRDRTLLMHDMRGHGASSMPPRGYTLTQLAEDFRVLLDDLGIARAHVVGHSHGARVAIVFALRYPDRVESLVIADTQIRALQKPMTLAQWPHWPEWKADLIRRGVTEFPPEDAEIDYRLLSELGPRAAGGRLQQAGAGPGAPGPGGPRRRRVAGAAGEGARIDLKSRQMGARGADRWQALLGTTSASEELGDETAIDLDALAGFAKPVLLMYGRFSHCLPTAEALEKLFPDARRVLVPGAGHFFPIVKPQFFARTLRTFLARVDTLAGRIVPDATARLDPRHPGRAFLRRRV